MAALVGAMVDLGYGVAWRVLDARHFGVPQRRRRVFIVGVRADGRAGAERAAEVLSVGSRCRGILRRASKRGRMLPPELEAALSSLAQSPAPPGSAKTTTPTPSSPVLLTMREGKPGGGKGPLLSENEA